MPLRKRKKTKNNRKDKHPVNGVRKLSVIGQSKTFYLTLPRRMVEKLNWKKGNRIQVDLKGKVIQLKNLAAKK